MVAVLPFVCLFVPSREGTAAGREEQAAKFNVTMGIAFAVEIRLAARSMDTDRQQAAFHFVQKRND